ncbi:MAG: inositol monophosphatase family protein, partial [Pseudomonadota bacterium]
MEPERAVAPPSADLDLITAAAVDAGRVALRFFRAECAQWEKEADAGPVSEADLAVNTLLMDRLAAARPDYGLLSEETEDDGSRARADRVFIIDPIDGTRAFLRGETGFAVAIAVVERGEVISSVVHLPARGETYAAERG